MGPLRRKGNGNRIVVLSVALSTLLMLGVIAALFVPTVLEHRRAVALGTERAGLAAAGYAERVASLLDRADQLATSAARLGEVSGSGEAYALLREALQRDARWSSAVDGYVAVSPSGVILDQFLKGRTDMRAFSGPSVVARTREHWSGPVVRIARPIGRQAWFLAVERGAWTEEGAFNGAGVAFLSLESALREAVVGRLFDNALIRLQTLEGALLFESRSGEGDARDIWVSGPRQKAYLDLLQPDSPAAVVAGRQFGLFLASQRVPGLPLIISVQIPEEVFLHDAVRAEQTALAVVGVMMVLTALILTMIVRDRVWQRRAEQKLHDAEDRLQFALFAGGLGLWELWWDTGRLEVVDRAVAALGYRRGQWRDTVRGVLRRIHRDDRQVLRRIWRQMRDGEISRCHDDIRLQAADGRWIWYRVDGRIAERRADGDPVRMIGVLHDISTEKGREESLAYEATHDPLLGLLNRKVFDAACAAPCGPGGPVGMIVFDIDHFKAVNDTYGHAVGDEVLKTVADRVRSALRAEESGQLFRIGGEEFVLLLPGQGTVAAAAVAERLRQAVGGTPMPVGGQQLRVTASFGVCGSDRIAGGVIRDLFGLADEALYCAKENGRDQVQCHGAPGPREAAGAVSRPLPAEPAAGC